MQKIMISMLLALTFSISSSTEVNEVVSDKKNAIYWQDNTSSQEAPAVAVIFSFFP